MILDAIATHPKGTRAVAMVATDGVYFTSPHPGLPISDQLGDWDTAEKVNLTLFKPGVYWDDKARAAIREGEKPQFKARGVDAQAFAKRIGKIDEWFGSWSGQYPEADSDWPVVTFPLNFSMVSPLQALQRGKWDTAGVVTDSSERTEKSNPDGKRSNGYYDQQSDVYRSKPFNGRNRVGEIETSMPYSKGLRVEDQEWRDSVTPDGYSSQAIRDALGMG